MVSEAVKLGFEKRRATFAKKKRLKEIAHLSVLSRRKKAVNNLEVEVVDRETYLPVLQGTGLVDWCEKNNIKLEEILSDGSSKYLLIENKKVYDKVSKLLESLKKMR